jgi:hypothetical protein
MREMKSMATSSQASRADFFQSAHAILEKFCQERLLNYRVRVSEQSTLWRDLTDMIGKLFAFLSTFILPDRIAFSRGKWSIQCDWSVDVSWQERRLLMQTSCHLYPNQALLQHTDIHVKARLILRRFFARIDMWAGKRRQYI